MMARLAVDHAAALQVTLLREHCQGPNAMLYTLPTGGFDPRKSPSALAAARAELSEEVCTAPALPALQRGQSMSWWQGMILEGFSGSCHPASNVRMSLQCSCRGLAGEGTACPSVMPDGDENFCVA